METQKGKPRFAQEYDVSEWLVFHIIYKKRMATLAEISSALKRILRHIIEYEKKDFYFSFLLKEWIENKTGTDLEVIHYPTGDHYFLSCYRARLIFQRKKEVWHLVEEITKITPSILEKLINSSKISVSESDPVKTITA